MQKENITNLEYVRQLSKEKIAKLLVYSESDMEYEYDWDEEPYLYGMNTYWFQPFCGYCFDTEEEALEDCIKCLDKKFKGIYNDK